jgi:hypothetical protein
MSDDLKALAEAEAAALRTQKEHNTEATLEAWLTAMGAFHRALAVAYRSGELISKADLEDILATDYETTAVEAARAQAIEECARIVQDEGRKARRYPDEAVAESYCDDAAIAIRALATKGNAE